MAYVLEDIVILPICQNNLCKRPFIPDVYKLFSLIMSSVSYYRVRYCTTLNICVCHLFVQVKRVIEQ